MMARIWLLAAGLITTACVTVGPDYQPPAVTVDDNWHSAHASIEKTHQGTDDSVQWWQQFNDPLLLQLIEKALHNNRDLSVALATIERSRASRDVADAADFPVVDAKVSSSRSRFSRQTGFGANTGIRNTYNPSLDASWELDLFGRNQRTQEQAVALLAADEAAKEAIALTVAAEVATNYFEIRSLQRQISLTRNDMKLLQEVESIAQVQLDSGDASSLGLLQARSARENTATRIPAMEAEIITRMHRIAVLTGQPPEHYKSALQASHEVMMPVDLIPLGLRSTILRSRPDVRQAERQLAAASAAIGVAKADLFPNFSLTGSVGSSSRVFSDLFSPGTLVASIGSILSWPVFSAGALTSQVAIAEADYRSALASYEQTVLLALEDAENALVRYGKEWQHLKLLQRTEASHNETLALAHMRYQAGEDDIMPSLNAEQALSNTRNEIIRSETQILVYLTQLYKSLGGNWQSSKPSP